MLDTDIPLNDPADRPITGVLYVRGREMRLCQEIVLGVGGVRALHALGIHPSVWHMNEGHVAFLGLERAREKVVRGDSLDEALKMVAKNSVFTTHTPVPAGNDIFAPPLIQHYFSSYLPQLRVDWQEFLGLGRQNPQDHNEHYCMTVLALRLANVPMPKGSAAVSALSTVTCARGTPSASAVNCANVVACPCPCEQAPVTTTTPPEASTATVAPS
jgi:starch phosphorylase